MRRILVLGENAIDVKVMLKSLNLDEDENHLPEESVISIGGTGINFSYALSKLKETPVYFTPISKDPFGRSIKEFLEENRIYYFDFNSSKPTPVVVSIISEGKRITIANIKATSYTDISFDMFKNANLHYDFVYVSGGLLTEERPQEETLKIVALAREQSQFLFFDPQVRIGKNIAGFKETCEKLFGYADFILANEKEIEFFDTPIIKDFLARDKVLVIKMGKKGAKLITQLREYTVTSEEVRSLNVVGAGDVFNAAFVKAFLNTNNFKESLSFANSFAKQYVERGL